LKLDANEAKAEVEKKKEHAKKKQENRELHIRNKKAEALK